MPLPDLQDYSNLPGGGVNAVMSSNNALADAMLKHRMNQVSAQYQPGLLQNQLLKGQLGNQKSQAEQPYWGAQAQANLASTQANTGLTDQQIKQAQWKLDHPLFMASSSDAQTIGSINLLRDIGKTDEANALQNMFNARQKSLMSGSNLKQSQSGLYNFKNLPLDEKSRQIAYATGMGYDAQDAMNQFSQGKTLDDLAKQKGIADVNQVTPNYPVSKAFLTRQQTRESALNEVQAVKSIVDEGLGEFSGPKYENSAALLAAAMKSSGVKNQEIDNRVGKYYGALMAKPEIALLTQFVSNPGGKPGIEAMNHIEQALYGPTPDLRGITGLTDSQRKIAQGQYKQILQKMYNSANKVGRLHGQPTSDQGNKSSDVVNVISPDGTPGTIPRNRLEEAQKRGFKEA